ncbi:hypothetical protein IV63_GL001622 [Companilactobacillus crustorum]|uniref:Uncharacterized protein n=1 Tax=Companilactobacillus crustorum TaxID=392416 RepID=A0ABR5Q8R8_9LACO|nr:hypothetical protein IV63_GL001622 [Companilactobacillus crustorum]
MHLHKIFYALETFFEASASAKYNNPVTTFSSIFLTFPDGARLEIGTRDDLNKHHESGIH